METKGWVNKRMDKQKGQGPMKSEMKGEMNKRNYTMIESRSKYQIQERRKGIKKMKRCIGQGLEGSKS